MYASFGRRLGAALLDLLIMFIPAAILGSALPVVGGLIVWFFYAPFFESSVIRATIGKKLMGIQVSDVAGGRLSFKAAFLRSVMKFVSSCFLFIPHLLALFTQRRQALHDIVAESVVVYGRVEIPAVDAWLEQAREVFGGIAKSLPSQDRLSELERLQGLYERGALNKEEFEAEKQ
jgi:uncharacterized RDD family membrane protein YckC